MSIKAAWNALWNDDTQASQQKIELPEEMADIAEEVKSNVTYQLLAESLGPGKPVYSQRNFKTVADIAFAKNIYVFRAITMLSQACSGIPWKLYAKNSGEHITSHPILDLLAKPNNERSWPEVIEAMVAFWILTGNAYLNAVTPTSRKGAPIELWNLPPDRMTVIPNATEIEGYLYTVNGATKTFKASEIMHLKMFNAQDDLYGMSPVLVAASLVDQMNEGNDWNTALLQNSARPSGALVMSGMLADDQFRRLKRQIVEKYSGKRNAGKPLLLEGGLTWQQLSLSPVDLNWRDGKMELAKEIAVALGVPPEMLGTTQNRTYANFAEARKSFYTETVLPMMDRIQGHFNMWLVPQFGTGIELKYDREDVEALHDSKDVITNRAINLFSNGVVTWNEARTMVGFTTEAVGDFLYFETLKKVIGIDSIDEFLEQNIALPLQGQTIQALPTAASSDTQLEDMDTSLPDRGTALSTQEKSNVFSSALLQSEYQKSRRVSLKLQHKIETYLSVEATYVEKAVKDSVLPHYAPTRVEYMLKQHTEALSQLIASCYLLTVEEIGTGLSSTFNVWEDTIQHKISTSATEVVKNALSASIHAATMKLQLGIECGESLTLLSKRVENLYSYAERKKRAKTLSKHILEESEDILLSLKRKNVFLNA